MTLVKTALGLFKRTNTLMSLPPVSFILGSLKSVDQMEQAEQESKITLDKTKAKDDFMKIKDLLPFRTPKDVYGISPKISYDGVPPRHAAIKEAQCYRSFLSLKDGQFVMEKETLNGKIKPYLDFTPNSVETRLVSRVQPIPRNM